MRGAMRVRGSWLESHFLWQMRTFWTAVVSRDWALLHRAGAGRCSDSSSLMSTPLTGPVGAVGAGVGFGGAFVAMTLGAIVAGIWILYRVVRGWLALREGKAMHV